MPRVKLFNEEEALQKAMELFWEKGYASTSLTDLTNRLEIGKGSFYATFSSKRALFEKSFEYYRKLELDQFALLLSSEPDVKKGIEKLLRLNLDQLLSDDKLKGCFVANTCSELEEGDKKMQDILISHHTIIQSSLASYLKNEVKNPTQISHLIITFLMGMNQETKFNRDRESYSSSISSILSLLN